MRPLVYAANWKMHVPPGEARAFAATFLARTQPQDSRSYWFFPSAVSIEATSAALKDRADIRVGAQDVHWEPRGAFTGATSIQLAKGAGATGALVGHSERRHVFGETDAETRRKVRALLEAGMTPMLCIGETLAERVAEHTESVVTRQLREGLHSLSPADLSRVLIAYEPVWAIGTGKNATPDDAAEVHRAIRRVLTELGLVARATVLYGGSVNKGNVQALIAQEEIDGVLVGGASLDPEGWSELVQL
jgi:triosephosphate isomerase (TIM)